LYNLSPIQIHWFSVLNSFLMVLFLVGLVTMILMRTLRRDYARYTAEKSDLETLEKDMSEESGWKLVHGDVFRAPPRLALLCALVGTGAQIAVLVLLVILITIFGVLYEDRGSILTVFIVCYALTSFIGGYVSGSLYKQHEGKGWITTLLLTATLYPGATFAIAFILNT
jgi:transmembrane 9 superfamily member 3